MKEFCQKISLSFPKKVNVSWLSQCPKFYKQFYLQILHLFPTLSSKSLLHYMGCFSSPSFLFPQSLFLYLLSFLPTLPSLFIHAYPAKEMAGSKGNKTEGRPCGKHLQTKVLRGNQVVPGNEHQAYLLSPCVHSLKEWICLFSFLIIPLSPAKGYLNDEIFKLASARSWIVLKCLLLVVVCQFLWNKQQKTLPTNRKIRVEASPCY